jgi:hypothetical protein
VRKQVPDSPAGHSPFIWRAVIPGNAQVLVGGYSPSAYKAQVSEATGIMLYGPTLSGEDNEPYIGRYTRSGEKIVLRYGPFRGTLKATVQF